MKKKPFVVSLISLGCPKNTVDSERILALFLQQGWLLAESPDQSDVCLVNTCGFIESARQEVEEVLTEIKGLHRKVRPLVVALGCLVEHSEKHGFEAFLEQADRCVGFGDYLQLPDICKSLLKRKALPPVKASGDVAFPDLPRVITGSGHSVSLKISEGCSNMCSFCAIPGIRGRQISRPMDAVLREAKQLVEAGAREINIIAQDTSAYGLDLYQEHRLGQLLRELGTLDFDGWFRLMYVYPVNLKDDVLDVLAGDERFCPYVDMPLQHIADDMLESMNRRIGKDAVRSLLEKIRTRVDGVALRTAFIVGYPGETDQHFQELMTFVQEQQFDHMGVFTYSPEPGTASWKLEDGIPAEVKQDRMNQLMDLQRSISAAKLDKICGTQVDVMIDGVRSFDDPEEGTVELLTGRTRRQAIDIDGMVLIDADPDAVLPEPGTIEQVDISAASEYDLLGEINTE